MNHALRHFSIVDITHHAELASLTGKVKFQFSDTSRMSEGMEDYIVIDVVISVSKDDTLEAIKDSLIDKAALVLQSALTAISQPDDRLPVPAPTAKPH
jgi:hypothetical protein